MSLKLVSKYSALAPRSLLTLASAMRSTSAGRVGGAASSRTCILIQLHGSALQYVSLIHPSCAHSTLRGKQLRIYGTVLPMQISRPAMMSVSE